MNRVLSLAMSAALIGSPAMAQQVDPSGEARYFACREAASDPLEPVVFQPRGDGSGYVWSKYPEIAFESVGPAVIGRFEETYYRFDDRKYVVVDWTGHVTQGECVGLSEVISQVMGELTSP